MKFFSGKSNKNEDISKYEISTNEEEDIFFDGKPIKVQWSEESIKRYEKEKRQCELTTKAIKYFTDKRK
jgi:hypothetical protein